MKYRNTKSNRLLMKYGKDIIRKTWESNGYRKTADEFDTTVGVIRNIVKANNWKRPASYTPNLLKSVLNGTKQKSDFPHLCFDDAIFRYRVLLTENSECLDQINISLKPILVTGNGSTQAKTEFQITISKNNKLLWID